MIDTEVDWFYEPFHNPKIQEKGRINAKIYVLQNHRYRFVYWGLLGFFSIEGPLHARNPRIL